MTGHSTATDAQGKDWTYFDTGDDECMECHEHKAVWACTQTGHELCGFCFKVELKTIQNREG